MKEWLVTPSHALSNDCNANEDDTVVFEELRSKRVVACRCVEQLLKAHPLKLDSMIQAGLLKPLIIMACTAENPLQQHSSATALQSICLRMNPVRSCFSVPSHS